MMRSQIQLSEQQHGRLREIAHQRGLSLSALIRRWLDEKIAESDTASSRDDRVRAALSVLGKHKDSEEADDVAANHDRYLADAYGR
ncbi:MAG: CopG family transcriptional regulator [Deltaproteobacteria bacterium]|nr:CopG family transcriptional regulator [Deltaproteobacteria bacterium]